MRLEVLLMYCMLLNRNFFVPGEACLTSICLFHQRVLFRTKMWNVLSMETFPTTLRVVLHPLGKLLFLCAFYRHFCHVFFCKKCHGQMFAVGVSYEVYYSVFVAFFPTLKTMCEGSLKIAGIKIGDTSWNLQYTVYNIHVYVTVLFPQLRIATKNNNRVHFLHPTNYHPLFYCLFNIQYTLQCLFTC